MSQLQRFRTYILVAVVIAGIVVVLVVSSDSGEGDADPQDVTDAEVTSTDDQAAADDETPADDVTTSTAAPGPVYPGVGTAAALDNPNCDPETGRIRLPVRAAPPCVVEWPADADNGGSTAPGVSEDSIVMLLRVDVGPTNLVEDVGTSNQEWLDVIDIYNHHYELWGRQIRIEFLEASGSSEVAQRADATRAINDHDPFLAIDTTSTQEGTGIFASELAARGVIVWANSTPWQETQDQAGFRWGAQPDDRVAVLHATEYVGKRVADRPVQWAGDESLNGQARQLGLVHTDRWDRSFFEEQASTQGFELAETVSYDEDEPSAQRQERARVVIARLKDAGVTTVILGTDPIFTSQLTVAATDQDFFPEWVITGYGNHDSIFLARNYDQEQWAHAFGPGPIAANLSDQRTDVATLYRWHHGREALDPFARGQASQITRWPAACIQLAGPDLTAETFRDGCFSLPPTGGTYCDCVTTAGAAFGDGRLPWTDYTGSDDMTEKWWDAEFEGENEIGIVGLGTWMKVDGGRRYAIGDWTDEDPSVFDPEGAIDLYRGDPPPNDAPPEYEHEPHD